MTFNLKLSLVMWKRRVDWRLNRERYWIAHNDKDKIDHWSKLRKEAEAMVTKRQSQLGIGPVPGSKPGDPVLGSDSTGGPPHGVSPVHETSGLPGYPAQDWFSPAGSTAVAPVAGTIRRFSGHDPALGPIEGPHGPLGWTIYLAGNDGNDYFLTHMATRTVSVGQHVSQGQKIGTVADYDKYGTPSHIQQGIHQGAV